MQLPSVPRMLVFCAVILVLGLGTVLVGLGQMIVDGGQALIEVFKQRGAVTPTRSTTPQALMPLVDIALRRLF